MQILETGTQDKTVTSRLFVRCCEIYVEVILTENVAACRLQNTSAGMRRYSGKCVSPSEPLSLEHGSGIPYKGMPSVKSLSKYFPFVYKHV